MNHLGERGDGPSIALVTYSTRPRGGVVHTLALAEALQAAGARVRVVALGDPRAGFYRPFAVPHAIVPGPSGDLSLEQKVAASIDLLAARLADVCADGGVEVLHAQDCIAARAAARVRDAGAPVTVVRTVHHVDDFSSQVLMDCQREAILEPDRVLVVSRMWQTILARDYGVAAQVVPNGVDASRFAGADRRRARELRASVGAQERPLLLSVGGIEPRKGSDTLVRAMSLLRGRPGPLPVLAVIGGHSFQDHRAYRERVLDLVPALGLRLGPSAGATAGADVVTVGTVPEADVAAWYAAADVLAFPSVKEGFGLAVLEAMAAGVPVVTSDLPVFREYLEDEKDALLVPVEDPEALARALHRSLTDRALRDRLVGGGAEVVARYGWPASAARHRELYAAYRRFLSEESLSYPTRLG